MPANSSAPKKLAQILYNNRDRSTKLILQG
jgi:hypothetical protein